jgi:general secretion pathway protein B
VSFILDALKKLEQKKQQKNSVPDLLSEHASSPQASGKKGTWSYLLLAVLSLNAVILLFWLQPWKSEQNATTVDQTKAEKTVIASVEEEDLKLDQVKAVDESPPLPKEILSSEKGGTDNLSTVETKNNTSASIPEKENKTDIPLNDEPEVLPEGHEDELKGTNEKLSSLGISTTKDELTSLMEEIEKERLAIKPDASADAPEIEINESSQDDEVVDISQLPVSVRSELPKLSLNGHVYSDMSSSRIVNINGIIFREGEEISRSLTVEEITMTGVIFTYKGHRFKMRAF